MHTEKDACKLWCPMVRLGEADSTDNRSASAGFIKNDEPGAGVKWNCCIASSCAMWQWVDDEFEYLFSPPENDEWTHAPYLSGEGRKCDRWQREKKNRRGFCGLSRPFYIPTGNCGGGKP